MALGEALAKSRLSRQRGHGGRKAKGAKKRKAVKRPAAVMKPVVCSKAYVVNGGFLKNAHVVPTVEFGGEHFVKATLTENWLCKAASGKCRSLAPLSRTRVLGELRNLFAIAPAGLPSPPADGAPAASPHAAKGAGMHGFGLDDCMSGLGLDPPSEQARAKQFLKRNEDDEDALPHPGNSQLFMTQKTRKAAANKARTEAPRVVGVELPPSMRRDGVTSVRLLSRPPRGQTLRNGVYLSAAAVPWLVGQAISEVSEGGVAFQPSPPSLTAPSFSFRDRAWVARAKTPAGKLERRYFTVGVFVEMPDGRKRPATEAELRTSKDSMYEEAVQWQASVMEGCAP